MSMVDQRLSRANSRGALGAVLIAGTIPCAFLLGAMAVDFNHILAVQCELQNATDAGALAGAQVLWTAPDHASADAFTVTALNSADGTAVSNSNKNTLVTVLVLTPTVTNQGSVKVTAKRVISHLFAPMFGRNKDTLTANSTAGSSAPLQQTAASGTGKGVMVFPLAVDLTSIPKKQPIGLPLYMYKPGDSIDLIINSQQFKNAAFTGLTSKNTSASWLNSAIDQVLGLTPAIPGFIPSISVGDSISLNNGIDGQKTLAKGAEFAAMQGRDLLLPLVNVPLSMNQSTPVIGFIGLHVTNITVNSKNGIVETITGTIATLQSDGASGTPADTGNSQQNNFLQNSTVSPVKLIE